MDVSLYMQARSQWINLMDDKINPLKENVKLRKAIGLYERFIDTLPVDIVRKIRAAVDAETGP